jgi:hypothetical protein
MPIQIHIYDTTNIPKSKQFTHIKLKVLKMEGKIC